MTGYGSSSDQAAWASVCKRGIASGGIRPRHASSDVSEKGEQI